MNLFPDLSLIMLRKRAEYSQRRLHAMVVPCPHGKAHVSTRPLQPPIGNCVLSELPLPRTSASDVTTEVIPVVTQLTGGYKTATESSRGWLGSIDYNQSMAVYTWRHATCFLSCSTYIYRFITWIRIPIFKVDIYHLVWRALGWVAVWRSTEK